jgi:hypothetical protein
LAWQEEAAKQNSREAVLPAFGVNQSEAVVVRSASFNSANVTLFELRRASGKTA